MAMPVAVVIVAMVVVGVAILAVVMESSMHQPCTHTLS